MATIIRNNLMTEKGYTPYCGSMSRFCSNPRTRWNGEQFACPKCGFVTQFPKEFIEEYKTKWNIK